MILTAASWAAIYFIVWWTTLFAVLPFGVRSQAEEGDITPGSDPGAPAQARIARVFLITTVASGVIFAALYLLLTQTRFGLDDVPFLPRFDPPR